MWPKSPGGAGGGGGVCAPGTLARPRGDRKPGHRGLSPCRSPAPAGRAGRKFCRALSARAKLLNRKHRSAGAGRRRTVECAWPSGEWTDTRPATPASRCRAPAGAGVGPPGPGTRASSPLGWTLRPGAGGARDGSCLRGGRGAGRPGLCPGQPGALARPALRWHRCDLRPRQWTGAPPGDRPVLAGAPAILPAPPPSGSPSSLPTHSIPGSQGVFPPDLSPGACSLGWACDPGHPAPGAPAESGKGGGGRPADSARSQPSGSAGGRDSGYTRSCLWEKPGETTSQMWHPWGAREPQIPPGAGQAWGKVPLSPPVSLRPTPLAHKHCLSAVPQPPWNPGT